METSDSHRIKKALVSVSDKSGIIEFVTELANLGVEILSTGGTALLLRQAGLEVINVSEFTKFPEILDGRVKTLHPAIHSGLLAKLNNEEHLKELSDRGFESIDLVIVNLYPFEETLTRNKPHDDIIENIDIGGPAMLRSAAKNYEWSAPVVNPERYDEIISILKENNLTLPIKYRMELAGEVFSHTAYYDSVIASYFHKLNDIKYSVKAALPVKMAQSLRYGENPHQDAALYGNFFSIFKQLHGKELSFNNILDIDSASKLIVEFDEPTAAIIKHTNPCGVGTADNLVDAYNNAFETDNVSPFGGIITFNGIVDKPTAEAIHELFAEVIICTEFTDDALKILMRKRDRRLITFDFEKLKSIKSFDLKSVAGGYLMQDSNQKLMDENRLEVVTLRKPTEKEFKALRFAWKVCKHVKSNSIVYTLDDRTLAIGAGQMSRVDSARIAIEKAKMMGLSLKGSVVASDAFFPFADGILYAVEVGATAIIQPGGSVMDKEVIEAANQHDLSMVFTGIRHFKH